MSSVPRTGHCLTYPTNPINHGAIVGFSFFGFAVSSQPGNYKRKTGKKREIWKWRIFYWHSLFFRNYRQMILFLNLNSLVKVVVSFENSTSKATNPSIQIAFQFFCWKRLGEINILCKYKFYSFKLLVFCDINFNLKIQMKIYYTTRTDSSSVAHITPP